jgi:hypothetical protein
MDRIQGHEPKRLIVLGNRVAIVLSAVAIIAGLYSNHWRTVLRHALTLCLSCTGLGL